MNAPPKDTCDACGCEMGPVLTDAEARAELRRNFPEDANLPSEDLASLCHHCYAEVLSWYYGDN